MAAVGVLVLLAAAAIGWFARRVTEAPVLSEGSRTAAQLAVMPLRVLTPANAADAEYLGVGIADAITTRLANVRQITVRPTAAVLAYQDRGLDPAGMASALGVEHVLEGAIQQTEQVYRVSLQLVRADGVVVWGRSHDVPHSGLLGLQDVVAEQVVTALRLELSAPERARLKARDTNNPAAYEHYLRGRALLVNYTDAKMRDAIARFEAALALDGNFAAARAALATACAWFSVRFAYESEAASWGKRAEDEARRALVLDPSLAEAHLAIANAAGTLYQGFDWKSVLTETTVALTLDPSLDLAHVARMRAFYHLGLFEQAGEEHRMARALNPAPSVETDRLEIAALLFDGDFRAAAELARTLLERTDAPAIRHYLGLARYYTGDVKGAVEMLASARRGDQLDVRSQASLASIEAATGHTTEARARAAAIAGGSYMDHHVAYSLGAAFAHLGDPDASIRWLQQAADTGFPCYPWFERDPLLDPVKQRADFTRLLQRLRSAHEDARTRSLVR